MTSSIFATTASLYRRGVQGARPSMRRFARVFRFPWRTRATMRRDLDEEFSFHAEMRWRELVERGVSDTDAERIAWDEFGELDDAHSYIDVVDQAVEATTRRTEIMHNITRSVRYALRRLRRAPVFATTSVLTLTIGIGACALMASLVSTVLLKPLPYGHPERIAMIWGYVPSARLGFVEQPTHGRILTLLRDNTAAYEAIAGFRGNAFNFGDATQSERWAGVQAIGDVFSALGVSAQRGQRDITKVQSDEHLLEVHRRASLADAGRPSHREANRDELHSTTVGRWLESCPPTHGRHRHHRRRPNRLEGANGEAAGLRALLEYQSLDCHFS